MFFEKKPLKMSHSIAIKVATAVDNNNINALESFL